MIVHFGSDVLLLCNILFSQSPQLIPNPFSRGVWGLYSLILQLHGLKGYERLGIRYKNYYMTPLANLVFLLFFVDTVFLASCDLVFFLFVGDDDVLSGSLAVQLNTCAKGYRKCPSPLLEGNIGDRKSVV